jgi:hypothetical protein
MTGRGRPTEGERFESRLTPEQIEWLDHRAGMWLGLHGSSRAARMRAVVERAMIDSASEADVTCTHCGAKGHSAIPDADLAILDLEAEMLSITRAELVRNIIGGWIATGYER